MNVMKFLYPPMTVGVIGPHMSVWVSCHRSWHFVDPLFQILFLAT